LTKLADAHIPGHEEWNDVLAASKNQYNGQCCDLGDAQLVEFDDWRRTIDGNYEVYLLGRWRPIEPWKITINQVNPTGKAIIWYDADPEEEQGCSTLSTEFPVEERIGSGESGSVSILAER
jgi:hypothetical protein